MKKFFFSIAAIASSIAYAQTFPPVQTVEEIQNELNFLTSSSDQVGFTYQGTIGTLNGLALPLSYYSTPDYWGAYVGTIAGNNLDVVDAYNPGDYTVTPTANSPGKDLQIERVNVYFGTDIYDAACWQIALGVCGSAGLQSPTGANLFDVAGSQDELLYMGYDGNAPKIQPGANRATTLANGTFSYNGTSITQASNAYFFRMVTRNWLSDDPFIGTQYMQHVTAQGLPPNPQYQVGKITWLDWKPITGENAWAFFIGPLQTAHLKQKSLGVNFIPFASTAVQNALNTLVALRSMQSELGAIYYACKGSLGNQGDQPVNPYEVSVENNASALAGLMIFEQILQDELTYESDLTPDQMHQVQTALGDIATMVTGRVSPHGPATKGLLSFFKNNAWDAEAGIFYQGGDANNPNLGVDWQPTSEPKAVDVTTWGISVIGQPLIDAWNGFGTAYQSWQNIKSWGGFFGPDGSIWGVGYSDQDGNGSSGSYQNGIISAEWTAGAINMVRCLIDQYTDASTNPGYSSAQQAQALICVQNLQKDHDSMYKNLMTLRTDLYPTTDAYSSARPDNYDSLVPIPSGKLAFIYASKRYMIPFGWFANPLPSTTSTSWAIMLHYNFNPFKIGGDYSPYSFGSEDIEGNLSGALPTILIDHVVPGCDIKRKQADQN